MPDLTVVTQARDITDACLRDLERGANVIIRAHAGAGKTGGRSSGTVRIAGALARHGLRVALLIAQNDQVADTLDRLTNTWPDVTTTFVPASSGIADSIAMLIAERRANLAVARTGSPARLNFETGSGLFVMTVSKFTYLAPTGSAPGQRVTHVRPFDVVIVDEAWMAPATLNLNLDRLAKQVALIGDPGQIMPWLPDSEYYPGMTGSIVEPLPELVRRERTNVVEYDLAVTRRNASHTTRLTGLLPAYTGTGTRPLLDATEVPVTLGAIPLQRHSIDTALRTMTSDGVALHRLPAGLADQADPDVARACATAADRLLHLGAELGHPDGIRQLTPEGTAVLVAHHDQRVAVIKALADLGRRGGDMPRVETFNTIQGATVDIAVVWHPLSGRGDVNAFHADSGRLTVGLTRHTHGCLLVSRDGIGEAIRSAPVATDLEGDAYDGRHTGLAAHRVVWEALT
jgi:hypothetical protein